MADNDPPSPPRAQTFQGLGSLRQALQQARAAPAAPVPTGSVPEDVRPQIDALGRSYATGKRKNAVARVWIKPGAGRIDVNGRESPVYFARPVLRMLINQPLVATNRLGQFDVWCTVKGGGLSGQAGAVRHGISQALTRYEPGLRPLVEEPGLSHPRQPRRRAQKIRQSQSPPQLPVLEALDKQIAPRRHGGHQGKSDRSPCLRGEIEWGRR